MAQYGTLKEAVQAVIRTNGNEEITGALLQEVLLAIINALGAGYQYMGVATPSTNPGASPDGNLFYVATEAGTYTYLGNTEYDGSGLAVFTYNGEWHLSVLAIPTTETLTDLLAEKVDKVAGKGLSTNDFTDALKTLVEDAVQQSKIAQTLGEDTTKVISQAAITAILLEYAKVDGYYSQMTAGAAENLIGRGFVPAEFLRRTTGGSADVGTGSAKIAKLMGNSIVWNQVMPSDASAQTIDATSTIDGNIVTLLATAQGGRYVISQPYYTFEGHKYYYAVRVKTSAAAGDILLRIGGNGLASNKAASDWQTIACISDIIGSVAVADGRASGWDDILFDKRVLTVDLTKMFGAGKEPTTVAEFEALFPLDYYAYEPGKVLPFAAEKLVTTGFNQFNPATGIAKLLGGNKYQLTGTYTAATIDGVAVTLDSENCFTPDADCELVITGGNETDTCVHLVWSGYRNGEYEPYELHELVMDPANWEDADGNKIFPYGGMHGVGTARDFATPDADGFIRKATRIWDRRAYAAGDENDPAVITDGSTYTFVQLAAPVETELAEPVAVSYYANDFGTEEWQPANTDVPYTAPCDMNIAYAMNAVDTLRRLPENYISTGSFENFCSELATKLGAALNKTITITPTYDSENAEYDYAITIADIEG